MNQKQNTCPQVLRILAQLEQMRAQAELIANGSDVDLPDRIFWRGKADAYADAMLAIEEVVSHER